MKPIFFSHSSSPKNTFMGIQPSCTTLTRVVMPVSVASSSSDNTQPSRSKLEAILAGVVLLGITLVPRCSPHFRLLLRIHHGQHLHPQAIKGRERRLQNLSRRLAFGLGHAGHGWIVHEVGVAVNGG